MTEKTSLGDNWVLKNEYELIRQRILESINSENCKHRGSEAKENLAPSGN